MADVVLVVIDVYYANAITSRYTNLLEDESIKIRRSLSTSSTGLVLH